jgi:hypothetical protein
MLLRRLTLPLLVSKNCSVFLIISKATGIEQRPVSDKENSKD